jgi:hypothetical protein
LRRPPQTNLENRHGSRLQYETEEAATLRTHLTGTHVHPGLPPGGRATGHREPSNVAGHRNAIMLVDRYDVLVGYVKRHEADVLAPLMDEGVILEVHA